VTGETIADVVRIFAPEFAGTILERTFDSCEEVVNWLADKAATMNRRLATLAGFEIAILDLASKEFRCPLWKLFGDPPGDELPAGVVIGFDIGDEALERHCGMLRLTGKRHIKVKVGQPSDLSRLETVFRILGSTASIRIDANGVWSVEDACRNLLRLRRFNIRSVEQPVAAGDISGMRRVRREVGLAVMADEALCTFDDARRLIDAEAVDIFNVRLGKCGGFLASTRLVRLAEESGLACHLGTLVGETGILSSAAEVFGRSVGHFECLEGKGQHRFLLKHDIVKQNVGDDGFANAGGLGNTILPDRLEQFRRFPPDILVSGHST